ncbi:MAG: EAL domain-containing protein [Alphaproteobacteria bacterium]|nr:EAL domain-containing protein [Alphaproteobacteria bacterium]
MSRVLCIDDEDLIREDLIEELTDAGHEVRGARDGVEGLEAIYQFNPDVVLCDVNMPNMNGHELLRELRANHPEKSNVPFIFLTAFGGSGNVVDGLQMGADDYLTKPVEYDLLLAKIESAQRVRDSYETKIAYASHFDSVTGLPNRVLALDRLLQQLAHGYERQDRIAALTVGVIDFKKITDAMGRAAGDMVLREAAQRISACVGDEETVAFLGGSEFLVIASDRNYNAETIVRRVIDAFDTPVFAESQEIKVGVSVGAAIFPDDAQDPFTMLRNADAAMSLAAQEGGGSYRFFRRELSDQVEQRMLLEALLNSALERDEFALLYQPIIDGASGRIVAAEALLRWNNPEVDRAGPDVFIPIVERNGQILPIGEWALRTACRQAKTWNDVHGFPVKMAVNLSARQFTSGDLVGVVRKILEETGLSPRLLELEVTERLLMDDSHDLMSTMTALRDIGVSLSIDDFGTGYSALSYLKKYPFDTLKVDRAFVSGVEDDESDATLVRAIVAMAHGLRLEVVAEGIESAGQQTFLKTLNVEYLQGYHFARPLSAEDFTALLRDEQ